LQNNKIDTQNKNIEILLEKFENIKSKNYIQNTYNLKDSLDSF
jgi:hypothetical protein